MSIHFRSRIQTPIDYSAYLFSGMSGCCCTGSSDISSKSFKSTYGACNALGGYFFEADECSGFCLPQGKTGCCCACFYGGITEGIEKTVCEDLDGVWTEGSCSKVNPATFCISGDRDVRNTRKCCGYTLIAGTTQSKCFSVCTEADCAKLNSDGYSTIFYPATGNCDTNPGCSSVINTKKPNNSSFITGNVELDTYGNCCVQGVPCRCFESINFKDCERLNGSFYLLGEKDFSCSECSRNCTQGEP